MLFLSVQLGNARAQIQIVAQAILPAVIIQEYLARVTLSFRFADTLYLLFSNDVFDFVYKSYDVKFETSENVRLVEVEMGPCEELRTRTLI